jgi:L-ascorbate 6-phosphate lactonase
MSARNVGVVAAGVGILLAVGGCGNVVQVDGVRGGGGGKGNAEPLRSNMQKISMRELRAFNVPAKSVALWWLGQGGFVLKSPGGKIVVLDPYLSNSCKALGDRVGFDLDRLVPPPIEAADLVGVDLYAITHSHQDHLDPETVSAYRNAGGKGPWLAPPETTEKLVGLGVPRDDIWMTWPNKSVTLGDLTIRATFAIPNGGDDLTHVGYIVRVQDGPTVYFTGDTSYAEILGIAAAEHKPDILVAVINGGFLNMGPEQAARLAKQLNPKVVIPCHHDLFRDNLQYPQLLRSNLKMFGLGDAYKSLEHGVAFVYGR